MLGRANPILVRSGTLLAVTVWAVFLYWSGLQWTPNSDNASVVLLGQWFQQGHVFLHGWILDSDPFWLSEVPLYAAGVAVFGPTTFLTHAVPTAIWLGIGCGGAAAAARLVAPGGRTVGAALAFAALLAPGAGLLEGPIHVGTTLFCLAALWLLAEDVAGHSFAGVLGAVVLTAAIAGEPLAIVVAGIPALGAGLVTLAYRRRWTRGARPAIWSAAAILAAAALLYVKAVAGGFTVLPVPGHLAVSLPALRRGLAAAASNFSIWPLPTDARGWALTTPRLLLIAAAVAAAATLLWRVWPMVKTARNDHDDARLWFLLALAIGCLGNLAGYSFYAFEAAAGGRRMVPFFAFAAIAAAVLVGQAVAQPARRARPGAIVLAVLVGAASSVNLLTVALTPPPVDRQRDVVNWLERNGLHRGYGAYWDANILTLESGGAVLVRPVIGPTPIKPFPFNANTAWYIPAPANPVTFLVYEVGPTTNPTIEVDEGSAVATFGRPDRMATIDGRYEILVWSRDLAPSLRR